MSQYNHSVVMVYCSKLCHVQASPGGGGVACELIAHNENSEMMYVGMSLL